MRKVVFWIRIFQLLLVIYKKGRKVADRNNIDESLLIDYFSGHLSHEEEAIVEDWVAKSDKNKKLANQIFFIVSSTNELKEINSIDTMSALKKIKAKIRPVKIITILQRIAAVLALPLLCSTIYFMMKPEMKPEQYVTIKANAGMVASFVLPDKTEVWLNSGSTLKYPEQFYGKTRQVELTGEAFFNVTEDEKRNFVVALHDNLSIEVFGTKFNVEAYVDDENVRTTLVEGKIQFIDGHEKMVILRPSQRLTFSLKDKSLKVNNVSVTPDIAWTHGQIIFENTSLEDALSILSQRFNVKFDIKDKSLKDNYFTGQFSDESLNEILNYFTASSDIDYKRGNKDIIEIY